MPENNYPIPFGVLYPLNKIQKDLECIEMIMKYIEFMK